MRCGKCGKNKLKRNFYRSGKTPSGYMSYCKNCKRKDARQWAEDHRGSYIERQRACKAKNPALYKWHGIATRAVKLGLGLMPRVEFFAWFNSQKQECVYCGIGRDGAVALFGKSLSIDRKDNSLGYVSGNVALACSRCNTVKNAYLTYEQMMNVAALYFRPKAVFK